MKILLTAFEPFDGSPVNSGEKSVALVQGTIKGAEVVKVLLPTEFKGSTEALHKALTEHKPDAVLCIGQAGRRMEIDLERVAINIDDGRIPDNAGFQPKGKKIFTDGDAAYFATLPIEQMVERICAAGIPAIVSNSAGTYVCNHIMYALLYYLAKEFPQTKGGFMHVPALPEQVVGKVPLMPSMSKETIADAITTALEAMV